MKFNLYIIFPIFLFLNCQNKTENTQVDIITTNDSIQIKTIITEYSKDINQNTDSEMPEVYETEYQSPAIVYKNDNTLYVYADIRQDFRMFGYAEPDTTSQKMILYSIFTNDVENNPYKCPFGAYYETNGSMNGKILIFPADDPAFVKAEIFDIDIPNETISNIVYFPKDHIYFEEYDNYRY